MTGELFGFLVALSLFWTDDCVNKAKKVESLQWLNRDMRVSFMGLLVNKYVHVFDVHFHVFPLHIFFWLLFTENGERDANTENETPEAEVGLYTWK